MAMAVGVMMVRNVVVQKSFEVMQSAVLPIGNRMRAGDVSVSCR